ncbi:hypothetical protein [Mucilaginibacter flavidus]|uniref:hypothetical protein n=1 Tax=Mucilaginibacter flavidus TaxID=2949309 RepID=UPI002092EFA1|nr:hypothetical protein [Mucilaginibacter flavidus]MCO5949524.1 hypothetical protein [Mucilaginibacter flavidus]
MSEALIQYLPQIVMAVFYIAFAAIIHMLSFKFIRKAAPNILLPINEADEIQETLLNDGVVANEKIGIIIKQYKIAHKLKTYYRSLAVSYYQNYYVFTICSIVYTGLLAVALFVLAISGWKDSSENIKTVVLLTTLFASYYYFLPNVLNNRLNLQKNMDGVKIYQRIQFDILSFLNMAATTSAEETDKFITNIYNSFKDNYDYNITFDTTLLDKNPLDNFKGIKTK